MNIEELLQSLPSREDIASAVGLQSRSSSYLGGNTDILPMLGVFGTGMLFGAGLALLFSPKSGSELRRDLSEKAQEWGEQAKDMAEDYAGEARKLAGQSSSQSGQTSETSHRTPYSGTTGGRNI
ncbi:MAG TPA: YtxH domain-containing protein [Candidatus Limnocylindrales bacterium]|nr:YtxH domain-containing protein [Candidatus Limnocylindrales bacterium]